MTATVSLSLWLRATLFGWVVGIVLVVLLALAGEGLGVGGSQISVGLGMGIGVGLFQERALRFRLGPSRAWLWASALGLSLPFLVVDAARLLGHPIPYSLYATIIAAGASVGAAQARLLRPMGIAASAWVGASTVGWTAASLMGALADSFTAWSPVRGLKGALLYLVVVAAGGLFLGAATSVPLRTRAAVPPGE